MRIGTAPTSLPRSPPRRQRCEPSASSSWTSTFAAVSATASSRVRATRRWRSSSPPSPGSPGSDERDPNCVPSNREEIPMSGQTNVIEVTDATFEQQVVEESKVRPVVVDLWADWCGPCKMLGPILERAAEDQDGKFLLAKLDVDANQMTAAQFGVQSIPTVVAFKDGQPVDGFVGALPEPHVKQWISGLLPSEADDAAAEAAQEVESGDVAGAEKRFREAIAADDQNA